MELSLQVLRRYILRKHLVALFVLVFELLWDFHAIVGGEFCFLVEEFAFDVKDFIVLSPCKVSPVDLLVVVVSLQQTKLQPFLSL